MKKEEKQYILFDTIDYVRGLWEKIPGVEIRNQEIIVNTMNNTIDYEFSIKIPSNFWFIADTIKINDVSIIRVSLSCIYPISRSLQSSIKKEEGYNIYPELIPTDCELLEVKITYKVSRIEMVRELVYTSSTHDPGGSDENEYWLHAQLVDPGAFDGYGRFDMRDVDVTVGVNIINVLNIAIPSPFISRLKTLFQIFNQSDPRQQWKAIPQLRQLARYDTSGHEFEILKEIEALFLPTSFSNYIEIKKDFRYDTCVKGKEPYELPIEIIPKRMDVISRTDLTLEDEAADGLLIYKQEDFRKKIESVFGK